MAVKRLLSLDVVRAEVLDSIAKAKANNNKKEAQ